MVGFAFLCAGCHTTAGASKHGRESEASTPPSRANGHLEAALIKAFDSVRRRYARDIVGICMGAIDHGARAIRCYGKARPGGHAKPTPSTLFQIGSLTKTFTATLLALRVEQRKLGLDDPAKKYLPAGQRGTQLPASVTLLDLADHYSGLPRSTPANTDSVPSVNAYVRQAGPCLASPGCRAGAPGERYSYSNYAYGLLGELLARHEGFADGAVSAWEQDNRSSITAPLGMPDTHSWFGWRRLDSRAFEARRALPVRQTSPPYFPPAPYADAAAGLYSTPNDMMKWMAFNMGLSGTPDLSGARAYLYGTRATLRPREDPANKQRRIGLGWRVDSFGTGAHKVACVYKDGLARGFTASMIFIRGRGVGAFVMLNSEPHTPAIAAALINALPTAKKIAPRACGSGGG